MNVIGACVGFQLGIYECGGTDKWIKWAANFGDDDFTIESEFEVSEVAATGVCFVFYVGDIQQHFGLDCTNNQICYTDGLGATTFHGTTSLTVDKFHRIKFIRQSGMLTTYLEDMQIGDVLDLTEHVTAVGWRPWHNTIKVKSLYYIIGMINCVEVISKLNQFFSQPS